MKWTRASEHSYPLEIYLQVKDNIGMKRMGNFYIDDDGLHYFSVDRTGSYESYIIEEKHFDKLYWLDESPESSVWPGEEEIEKVIDENCGKKEDEDAAIPAFYFRMGLEWLKEWLQSRTAVKAESRYDSPNYKGGAQRTPIIPSQPTAGGVKEEVAGEIDTNEFTEQERLIWEMGYNDGYANGKANAEVSDEDRRLLSALEKANTLIEEHKSQPSPSNPSIKRPTEERKWNEELNIWEPPAKVEFKSWRFPHEENKDPNEANAEQDPKQHTIHLSGDHGKTVSEAAQLIAFRYKDGKLGFEIYPTEELAIAMKFHGCFSFNISPEAKQKLIDFLNINDGY